MVSRFLFAFRLLATLMACGLIDGVMEWSHRPSYLVSPFVASFQPIPAKGAIPAPRHTSSEPAAPARRHGIGSERRRLVSSPTTREDEPHVEFF
jgi:hypothetical protein